MGMVNKLKEVGSEIEGSIEDSVQKAKKSLANVAGHLPFANLSNKEGQSFVVEVDMPGIKKDDINIKIEDHVLIISAERKMKEEVKKEDYYRLESYYGQVSRSFNLSDDIDTEHVDARVENGRLYVTLKRLESKKPKSITVH
jgi:HSP20 family protein